MSARDLPSPSFQAEIAVGVDRRLQSCDNFWEGIRDDGHLGHAVIDGSPLRDCDWATLFAYMHRRFGPPHLAGDDYKDLSAAWLLTTPDPELFVAVRPSLSGPAFSFTAHTSAAATPDWRAGDRMGLTEERVSALAAAYRATLVDLMRPVCVRDQQFNALGQVKDRSELMAYDAAAGEAIYGAKYHPSCGYPMPAGLFGGDDWAALCRIVSHAGDGNYALGKQRLLAELQEERLARLANNATWPTLRLVLMACRPGDREMIVKGVSAGDISQSTIEQQLADDLATLKERQQGWIEMAETGMSAEIANSAARHLESVGIAGADAVRHASFWRCTAISQQAWDALACIDARERISESALPAKDEIAPSRGFVETLKVRFDRANRQDIVDWIDGTLRREGGIYTVAWVALRLADLAEKRRAQRVDGTAFDGSVFDEPEALDDGAGSPPRPDGMA